MATNSNFYSQNEIFEEYRKLKSAIADYDRTEGACKLSPDLYRRLVSLRRRAWESGLTPNDLEMGLNNHNLEIEKYYQHLDQSLNYYRHIYRERDACTVGKFYGSRYVVDCDRYRVRDGWEDNYKDPNSGNPFAPMSQFLPYQTY